MNLHYSDFKVSVPFRGFLFLTLIGTIPQLAIMSRFRPLPGIFVFNKHIENCIYMRGVEIVSVPFRGFLFLTYFKEVKSVKELKVSVPFRGFLFLTEKLQRFMEVSDNVFPSPSGDFCF